MIIDKDKVAVTSPDRNFVTQLMTNDGSRHCPLGAPFLPFNGHHEFLKS